MIGWPSIIKYGDKYLMYFNAFQRGNYAAKEVTGANTWRQYRMQQNYLWNEKGIQINAFMAATAWNLKKMMEKLREKLNHFFPAHFFRVFLSNCHSLDVA